jgi:hypothetical protein
MSWSIAVETTVWSYSGSSHSTSVSSARSIGRSHTAMIRSHIASNTMGRPSSTSASDAPAIGRTITLGACRNIEPVTDSCYRDAAGIRANVARYRHSHRLGGTRRVRCSQQVGQHLGDRDRDLDLDRADRHCCQQRHAEQAPSDALLAPFSAVRGVLFFPGWGDVEVVEDGSLGGGEAVESDAVVGVGESEALERGEGVVAGG